MMNRQIRVEFILAQLNMSKFNPSKREIRMLREYFFLAYSVGAVVYTALYYLTAAVNLPKRKKNLMISLFVCVILRNFVR